MVSSAEPLSVALVGDGKRKVSAKGPAPSEEQRQAKRSASACCRVCCVRLVPAEQQKGENFCPRLK